MTADVLPALFPIRDLVQQTGVNASTLRAWENRHGLLKPLRAPSGHRLYCMKDVHRVRRLRELLGQGMGLAEIVPLLEDSEHTKAPAAGSQPAVKVAMETRPAWRGYLDETLRALEDFSAERLDRLYNEACALYPIDVVTDSLFIPVLQQLGERWEQRVSGIAEEHFFSAWLRNKLGARLHHSAGSTRGRPLILACLPHESHEIGLLIFALAALQRNYRVIYLGANMPLRQILPICQRTHSAGIVLAGRAAKNPAALLDDLAWLVEAVGKVPVFIGSHCSVRVRDRILDAGAIPLGIDLALGLHIIETRIPLHRGR